MHPGVHLVASRLHPGLRKIDCAKFKKRRRDLYFLTLKKYKSCFCMFGTLAPPELQLVLRSLRSLRLGYFLCLWHTAFWGVDHYFFRNVFLWVWVYPTKTRSF